MRFVLRQAQHERVFPKLKTDTIHPEPFDPSAMLRTGYARDRLVEG
jgi:hypothetical protein